MKRPRGWISGSPLTVERIDTEFRKGDWASSPWFVHEHDEQLMRAGFARHLREQAARALVRVYPPEVCRELLLKRWYGWIVYPLFQGHLPFSVVPRLRLGLDLDTVQPWRDAELLRRLRNRETYNAAAFEVSVWANLLRGGCEVHRAPPGQRKKVADFAVVFDRRRYVIELKDLEHSDLDVLAGEVQELFHLGGRVSPAPSRAVVLHPSKSFRDTCLSDEGRTRIREDIDGVASAFHTRLREINAGGFVPGLYAVEPYGHIEVSVQNQIPSGVFECRLVPETSDWRRVQRIANEVAHASHQLPDSGVGVILLNVRAFAHLEALGTELARRVAEKPAKFRNCALVLVKLRERQNDDLPLPRVAVYPIGGHKLTPSEERLAHILTYDVSGAEPQPPPRTRLIRIGEFTAKSGQTTSISFSLSGDGKVTIDEK
ncbi:hypothetical protein [Myxococcus xanthus]|uniref:hypothetical protein n=1 Tax=Myxococcus xanthus TaxID=34 RepID=UPI00112C671B|nr:hypothetical protein [Myxococcus xanthus]